MYILNGIAHAGTAVQDMRVTAVKPLNDMMMLVTFASGERRLYDATQLLTTSCADACSSFKTIYDTGACPSFWSGASTVTHRFPKSISNPRRQQIQ